MNLAGRDFFPSYPRSRLARPKPALSDGQWELPPAPDLGVDLDPEVVTQSLVRWPVVIG